MAADPDIIQLEVCGYEVNVDLQIGHLWVLHDGKITWDQLQTIKNTVWGRDARAIEVYPAACDVVNTLNCRHLWRLGASDFAPDLLGNGGPVPEDSLQLRWTNAWAEARGAFAE